MKTKTTVGLLAIGVISLLAIGNPDAANANARNRQKILDRRAARAESAQVGELQKDRAELGRDRNELERDRADLNRLYRSRASRGEIASKRAEINQDIAEINQDRREIRDDYGVLRRDRGNTGSSSNVYGRNDTGGWWNRGDAGASNPGNNRWDGRRWGR
jgi:septal ring factor EnvC (AmiA/AmiB activator)